MGPKSWLALDGVVVDQDPARTIHDQILEELCLEPKIEQEFEFLMAHFSECYLGHPRLTQSSHARHDSTDS